MNHEVKIVNQREEANGTSFQGYVETSYGQLVSAFGKSMKGSEDGKVNHQWIVKIDGILCTIYDYKENLNNGKVSDWHVGGKAKACVQMVKEVLDNE